MNPFIWQGQPSIFTTDLVNAHLFNGINSRRKEAASKSEKNVLLLNSEGKRKRRRKLAS